MVKRSAGTGKIVHPGLSTEGKRLGRMQGWNSPKLLDHLAPQAAVHVRAMVLLAQVVNDVQRKAERLAMGAAVSRARGSGLT